MVPWHLQKTSSAYFSIDGSRGVEIRQLLLPSLHVLSCICNDLQFYLKTIRVFFLRGHTCSHILSYDFPLVVLSSRRDNMVAQVEVGILWRCAAPGLTGHGDLSQGAFSHGSGIYPLGVTNITMGEDPPSHEWENSLNISTGPFSIGSQCLLLMYPPWS